MAKLIDPDKEWYELVEERDDGSALRNDWVELKAANSNPWYVLATVYGEQTEFFVDRELHAKNRRIWNGWACSGLDEAEREKLAEELELPLEELAPLSDEEVERVRAAFEARLPQGALDDVPLDETGLPHPEASVVLSEIHFSHAVVWEKCIFHTTTWFTSASFSRGAWFVSASFSGDAWFTSANFLNLAWFPSASFSGYASFPSASFSGDARFTSASFNGYADFSDGSFKGQTSFMSAMFEKWVPEFYQRDMHQNTTFTTRVENWPKVTAENAEDSKQAYTRLRQIMLQLEKPDDAQFFARQEMRCKGQLETGLARWANLGFGAISDYGYSLSRPLYGLAGIWAVGALIFAASFYVSCYLHPDECLSWTNALGLSFSNQFSFFGFGRLFFSEVLEALPWYLQALSGFQTVSGFILLFFLGLGLRNHFRLK